MMQLEHARALVFAATALWLLVPAGASAQDNSPQDPRKPVWAGEGQPKQAKKGNDQSDYTTVVTGKLGPEERFTADRSISAVTAKQISERVPRSTPEALWDTPGTFVQQTNHGGGSPIVRGMIGPQVLLLIDGVRLSNSTYRTGPMQYLNLVDPLIIRSMEVMRGAGSMLYGSDAMGGVIQIIPKQPRDARDSDGIDGGWRLYLSNASANRGQTVHGLADGGHGGLSVLGAVTYKHLDDLSGGGDVGLQPYSGYRAWNETMNVTYRFSDGFFSGWKVKLGYLMAHVENAGRTDKLVDNKSLQIYDNEDHLLYGRLSFDVRRLRTRGELTFSMQHFFERKDGFKVAADLATRLSSTRDEVTAVTFGQDLRLTTSLLSDRLRLRYGSMFYRDWVSAGRQTWEPGQPWAEAADKAYPDGSGYDNYGIYVHAEGDVLQTADGGHHISVGGGYRLHGMRGDAPAAAGLPEVDLGSVGHVFQASAQYRYRRRANVALTFSQGFRAPNLQEAVMLGDTGKFFHIPNGDLSPEKADTIELLARARLWRARISWAGYVTLLHDLIKRIPARYKDQEKYGGKDVFINVNGGEGLLWGTEVQAQVELWWGLSVAGHLTYTWGEEQRADDSLVPLSRIPPLYGMVKVRYDTPRGWRWRGFVEAFVRAAGDQQRLSEEDQKDVRIPEGGTPGWWTLNLRAGAMVFHHLRVNLALENLLNVKYKYHGSGIWSPGTNAVVSVEGFY